ncbi:MAG TPA: glycosyl hydrolase, partial [Terriglobales bacterium]
MHFRSIGPASMSGRISDFAAYEANPAIFYVGSAHGGLWKTTDGGATFTPEFQNEGLMSVGAVAISQRNPDIVYLGTGEGTNRQSLSWGDGVWKSTDGGKSWKNLGLTHSYQISRIVVDPDNDNVALVAAQGALFGPGGDRGIYKTSDGGATWKQVLKIDEDTGANDIVMSASNHSVLYASSYQRRRTQCCVNGGGPGSGIWKSTDGGDTWKRLSGGGLPSGPLGRIGLAVYAHSENIVYAEIQGPTPAGAGRGGAGATATGETGVYRSDDGGATWSKFANPDNRPIYFSQVRVDPNNPDHVLVASVRLYLSTNGGRTFFPIDLSEHDDKHAIWWDPHNSNHLLIGTDGGAYTTWDMGKSWIWYPNLPVGLFYHVGFDNEQPYNVCGGMQDNYDWCGPSAVRTSGGISNDRWQTIQGGDGFVAIMDPRDSRTVFSETQDGNTMRHDRITGESKSIRPTPQNVIDAMPGGIGCDTPAAGTANAGGGGGGAPAPR